MNGQRVLDDAEHAAKREKTYLAMRLTGVLQKGVKATLGVFHYARLCNVAYVAYVS